MKLVLVVSMAAVLGMGMSGSALAHGSGAAVGGSVYWANDGYLVGLNYGGPYVAPYYVPPRYVYAPRTYRGAYRHGSGYGRGYHKGYYKGYRQGYRHDSRHDHRGYRHRRHGDH